MESKPTLLIEHKVQTEIISDAFEPEVDPYTRPSTDELIKQMTKTNGPDKIDLLAQLLQVVPRDELASLLGAFEKTPKTKRSTPHAGKVTQYKMITVHHFCRNCGYTHVYTIKLEKGALKVYTRKDGITQSVSVREDFKPIIVQNWGLSCEMCRFNIGKWSRELLEERYMQLLCRLEIGNDLYTMLND